MYNFKQLRSSLSTVFKCLTSVGLVSLVVYAIEIINNTRGGIEGKIGERGVWGANSNPGCSLIHDIPDKKSRFRRIFQLFFAVKILIMKISFQTV